MELLERRRALIEERLVDVVDGVDPETLNEEVRHVALSGKTRATDDYRAGLRDRRGPRRRG